LQQLVGPPNVQRRRELKARAVPVVAEYFVCAPMLLAVLKDVEVAGEFQRAV
jgi:hypothetical protein